MTSRMNSVPGTVCEVQTIAFCRRGAGGSFSLCIVCGTLVHKSRDSMISDCSTSRVDSTFSVCNEQ